MSKFTGGTWIADDMGEYVFSRTPEGLMSVAQMRGWGYLTGTLNLTPDEAIEVQKANSRLIVHAPEMYDLLKIWIQVGVEPMLRNARKRAEELLARIDGKEK